MERWRKVFVEKGEGRVCKVLSGMRWDLCHEGFSDGGRGGFGATIGKSNFLGCWVYLGGCGGLKREGAGDIC